MISIAITGGIGSGKSYVCQLLAEMGIPMYDADSQAKELMITDEIIRRQLIDLLGDDVYLNGQLNKRLLADYLFADETHAATINGIVHPRVRHHFTEWLKAHAMCEVAGLECAILFESGFQDTVDVVITVSAPYDVRLQRAMKRDNATAGQIQARMDMQMPEEDKIKQSRFVINNDGVAPLLPQLASITSTLKKENLTKICVSAR